MTFLSPYIGPLCWAAAIILLAIGNAAGLVDDAAVKSMFLILPIVAVVTSSKAGRCRVGRSA